MCCGCRAALGTPRSPRSLCASALLRLYPSRCEVKCEVYRVRDLRARNQLNLYVMYRHDKLLKYILRNDDIFQLSCITTIIQLEVHKLLPLHITYFSTLQAEIYTGRLNILSSTLQLKSKNNLKGSVNHQSKATSIK